jgi:uncharacterized protein YbbK (DUF523 family)
MYEKNSRNLHHELFDLCGEQKPSLLLVSPSCGIETTSKNGDEKPGQGVFMEVLSEVLSNNGITLPMIGTKTSEKEQSVEKIKQFLCE